MKVCPNCGQIDNPYWNHSRFEWNADCMKVAEFQREYPHLAKLLEGRKNHDPIEDDHYFYYLRGRSDRQVYRVWKPDYKMPRERKNHG